MAAPLSPQRRFATDFRVSDLVAVALCATVMALWLTAAAGRFSFAALVACQAACFTFYVVGSLAAGWRRFAAGLVFDLPLRLLVGYALVNTLLFAAAWLAPTGIVTNFAIIAVVAGALFALTRPTRASGSDNVPVLCTVAVALVAVTLWCQDSLLPIEVQGATTVVKPWIDGFFHALHVRMFGLAHGVSSLDDFRMAGITPRLYHYAPYVIPGFIKQVSGLPSYAVFAGTMVPMGLFFTGLGAYALVAPLWGRWPALAAGAALLLLPDGAQQGMRNYFLSYHWLAQISPAATYGIAMVALAWVFVLRGCTRGSLLQVVAGWGFGVLVAVYKAQFFVTIALVLMALPPLFLRARLRVRYRVAWLLATLAVFVTTMVWSQRLPGVPFIRLDGSSTGRVLSLILSFGDAKSIAAGIANVIGTNAPWLPNVFIGGPYLLVAVFGVMAPATVVMLVRVRRRVRPLLLLFPVLLTANFLVMALGLRLDNSHVGTPEELQHRPFLLLYFALVSWTAGAATFALLRSRWHGRAKVILVAALAGLLVVPVLRGPGVQDLATMPEQTRVRIPTALWHAAEHMRDHGDIRDVFQASSLDPMYIIAGLADRQPYFDRQVHWPRQSEQALTAERTQRVLELMQLQDPGMVMMAAAKLGIRWFLVAPEHAVAWSPTLAARPAFAEGGFRLYRLD